MLQLQNYYLVKTLDEFDIDIAIISEAWFIGNKLIAFSLYNVEKYGEEILIKIEHISKK